MNITFKYFRPKKFTGLTRIKVKKRKGWARVFYAHFPHARDDKGMLVDRLTGKVIEDEYYLFVTTNGETK